MTKQDGRAFMTQEEFDRLPEYSCSIPTGVIVGKQWKAGSPYVGRRTRWYMGEYAPVPEDPRQIGILWYDIVIGSPDDCVDFQI